MHYQDPQRGGLRVPVRAMSMVESGSMRTNIFAEIGRHIEQRLKIMVIPGITAFDAPAVCNMGSTTAGQDR
jgi:hypothetical protein